MITINHAMSRGYTLLTTEYTDPQTAKSIAAEIRAKKVCFAVVVYSVVQHSPLVCTYFVATKPHKKARTG